MQILGLSLAKFAKLSLSCLLFSSTLVFAQKTELKKDQKMVHPEYLISPNGKWTAELTEYGLCLCKREENGTKTVMWKSNNEIVKDSKGLGELSVMLTGSGDFNVYSGGSVIWHHPANNRMIAGFDLRACLDDYGQIIMQFYNNGVIWLQYERINYKTPNSSTPAPSQGGGSVRILPIPPPCPIQ